MCPMRKKRKIKESSIHGIILVVYSLCYIGMLCFFIWSMNYSGVMSEIHKTLCWIVYCGLLPGFVPLPFIYQNWTWALEKEQNHE